MVFDRLTPVWLRPTAEAVLRGHSLKDKCAVITGGTAGIGLATAKALVGADANVIIASRSRAKGDKVASELHSRQGKVAAVQLDLTDTCSIRHRADDIEALTPHIDYLVLNAGHKIGPLVRTEHGFDNQLAANHMGHFLLTQCLLTRMLKQDRPARIIVLTSLAHVYGSKWLNLDDLHFQKREHSDVGAYCQSKLANVLYARHLAARLKDTKITVFAVHPGLILTNIWKTPWTYGDRWHKVVERSLYPWFRTAEQGAATVAYAAVDNDLQQSSGAYLVDCKVRQPHKAALDYDLAALLWEITEKQLADCQC